MGAGDYKVLKGHFPSAALLDLLSVNNRPQEIPIPDSCTFFVCVDECGLTSDPISQNGLRMTVRKTGRQLTLITLISEGKHQLC